jgi:2'-5' RNA ligase
MQFQSAFNLTDQKFSIAKEELDFSAKIPLYVAVRWSEDVTELIKQFVAEHPVIDDPVACADLHTTIIYSKKKVFPELLYSCPNYTASFDRLDIFGGALVLVLRSKSLKNRHNELMALSSASYNFVEYIPHITLSYNFPKERLKELNDTFFNNYLFVSANEYDEEVSKKF